MSRNNSILAIKALLSTVGAVIACVMVWHQWQNLPPVATAAVTIQQKEAPKPPNLQEMKQAALIEGVNLELGPDKILELAIEEYRLMEPKTADLETAYSVLLLIREHRQWKKEREECRGMVEICLGYVSVQEKHLNEMQNVPDNVRLSLLLSRQRLQQMHSHLK